MLADSMVEIIRRRGVNDKRVLAAMKAVPRHEFVPTSNQRSAYGDHAMSIGYRQTISQPYIVAVMSEALSVETGDRVLEIGTGSGYQSAILAHMGIDVYSMERIPELYESARERLERLGYDVHCRLGDGSEGWDEYAPYSGIIVTAAPTHTPDALRDQLAEGGHLVIPLGRPHGYQRLWCFTKHDDELIPKDLGGVAFVPFIRDSEV